MLGGCPLRAEVLPVALEADIEALRALADQRADVLDDGDGVLVLTDLYGSTPSNIAASLASRGAVRIVSGLNLPMLVRVLNYPAEDLAGLADKAVTGGNRGILLCGARSPDAA
jgi:PTS system ascorbate-specific IIA component